MRGAARAATISRSAGPVTLAVEYLVLGGGGSGAGCWAPTDWSAGGGSAGEHLAGTLNLSPGTAYTLRVGAGGPATAAQGINGNNGEASTFATVTAAAGIGGRYDSSATGVNGPGGRGAHTGTGTSGRNGGAGSGADSARGGGGGAGNGAAGGAGSATAGGAGGAGVASSITGASVTRGAGGGGGAAGTGTRGAGGAGGGGTGGNSANPPTAGADATGSGGGGAGGEVRSGAKGGNGIVILKIPDTRTASFSGGVTWSGGTPSGGFRVYTITAAGSGQTVTFT